MKKFSTNSTSINGVDIKNTTSGLLVFANNQRKSVSTRVGQLDVFESYLVVGRLLILKVQDRPLYVLYKTSKKTFFSFNTSCKEKKKIFSSFRIVANAIRIQATQYLTIDPENLKEVL